ncbi:hypothetical protein OGW07_13125 [Citrobacter sp. Cf078]|uniref:hypothetical protein n=1 Tax=Citrobacter sp. Cf078 TaxID=2985050 RepID=UPI002576A4DE|nr:hypothetical protein [Citrobacter sp. Cf078]MDM3232129.1 hypothetical protein [Citrobacter sp. Cf078]
MSNIFLKNGYGRRVWRLLNTTYDILKGDKPVKDLRRKLNRMIRSIKEIEKDLEYYRGSYEPPKIIEISPRDCGIAGFYIMSCWRDNFELYTPETYEELFTQDKEFFLEMLNSHLNGLNSCKNDLIEKGFLTEADFL